MLRALRSDRLTASLARFVGGALGKEYVTSRPFDLERSFQVRALEEGPGQAI